MAISLEEQDDPTLHLVRLETTGGQFLGRGFDEVGPTLVALVAMLARCDQRNESGVITTGSSGKVVCVESDKWPDYRRRG